MVDSESDWISATWLHSTELLTAASAVADGAGAAVSLVTADL